MLQDVNLFHSTHERFLLYSLALFHCTKDHGGEDLLWKENLIIYPYRSTSAMFNLSDSCRATITVIITRVSRCQGQNQDQGPILLGSVQLHGLQQKCVHLSSLRSWPWLIWNKSLILKHCITYNMVSVKAMQYHACGLRKPAFYPWLCFWPTHCRACNWFRQGKQWREGKQVKLSEEIC